MIIFRGFFDDFEGFASKKKIKQNLGTHHKIRKNYENRRFLQVFLFFFKQNDIFLMICWWFPRFCLIFSFEAKHSKIIEKSSKNHQKIIKKSSFCLKNNETPRFWQVFLFFSSKTIIFRLFFDDFSMIFESFASKEKIKQNLGNHQKINKKSSKNHRFAWKTMKIQDFGKFS